MIINSEVYPYKFRIPNKFGENDTFLISNLEELQKPEYVPNELINNLNLEEYRDIVISIQNCFNERRRKARVLYRAIFINLLVFGIIIGLSFLLNDKNRLVVQVLDLGLIFILLVFIVIMIGRKPLNKLLKELNEKYSKNNIYIKNKIKRLKLYKRTKVTKINIYFKPIAINKTPIGDKYSKTPVKEKSIIQPSFQTQHSIDIIDENPK